MPTLPIYMDHHATTPTDPRVVESMLPFFTGTFGNPASRHHSFGWAARDAVEASRKKVSTLVGCDPRELFFTSGATESNNLAIKGCLAKARRPAHVVTVETEQDERGDAEYNQRLSVKRADHVKDVLIAGGVSPERITVKAHGESPASDENVDSYAFERRVSMTLYIEDMPSFASNPGK